MRITDFIEFSSFFNAYMRNQRAEGSRISYRFLVKELGLQSTSSLAMIATGKRLPSDELLERLCKKLKMSESELEYARNMLGYAKAKHPDERQFFWEKMNRLRPQSEQQQVDLDLLELISQWDFLVLICMAGEEQGIDNDLERLSQTLKHRVPAHQLKDKLDRLESLGFIVKGADDRYYGNTGKTLVTPPGITSTLIKNMHQQMLQIAREEIYQQGIEERYFTSMFMTMSPRKLGRAKELLNAFRSDFDSNMAEDESSEPTEVYQLGMQFFKMTDRLRLAKDGDHGRN